jgi:hypothetical protein
VRGSDATIRSTPGTAAPINFNGLVRQYYLRAGRPSSATSRSTWSTENIARAPEPRHRPRRARAAAGDRPRGIEANVKVVEVPPGPPVLAPLVAEIYGLDYPGADRSGPAGARRVRRHARTSWTWTTPSKRHPSRS